MIRGCRDKRTERFLAGQRVREFQPFERQAQRRLTVLAEATCLMDLARLPSNRFEALRGNRKGQYSIRINDQWRLCFTWVPLDPMPPGLDPMLVPGEPDLVEITDYH